jgi:cytochrome c-type biogenesis protein CcsB
MSSETASAVSDLLVDGTMVAWVIALVGFALAGGSTAEIAGRQRALVVVGSQAGSVDPPADSGTAQGAPTTTETSRWTGVGWATFAAGTALLVLSVLARGIAVGRAPWGNMYEFSLVGITVLAGLVLLTRRREGVGTLMPWVAAIGLVGLGLAQLVLYVPAGPLVPALDSPWLVIHVAAAIIATAIFTVSMIASTLFLVAERRESAGRSGSRLPRSRSMELLSYRMVTVAFPIWSFAVVAGAIWAEYAWGRYWGWDPKETWSLITWVVYAAFLHARTTAGWRGRRAAVISLVGYATLMFNFFGVNILLPGLHSYGGL